MALPDPITVAAASPTPQLVFTTVRFDGYGSERVDSGGNGYTTVINHTPGKNNNRHYVKLTQRVNAVNPYSGLTQAKEASVSISITRPDFGFSDAAMVALVTALRDFVFDSEVTPAKLLQNQS
jgi:hypothetical protein